MICRIVLVLSLAGSACSSAAPAGAGPAGRVEATAASPEAPSAASEPPEASSGPAGGGPARGKRAPCQSDQACNEDPSVSALWGRCTELGVCECKPGFERSPTSDLCRPLEH